MPWIEAYALLGDCKTAALVSREGSIDWLCAPRFDSASFFSALLGNEDNGHWQIAPSEPVKNIERRYRPETLVLETDFETGSGRARLIDCLAVGDGPPDLMRLVTGLEGEGLEESGERGFILCAGWLGSVYAMQGRDKDAERVLDLITSAANDVGLLAEQYDPVAKRQLNNFPQAFSHLALIMLELALRDGDLLKY